MRVYHFVNKEHGINDLEKRRIKIATLNELNDPFEFFGVNLSDKALRQAFRKMKGELSEERGLLCFSRDWHNPLQWSHYAEKHRGLCLGFDVLNKQLDSVIYSRKRLSDNLERLLSFRQLDPETIKKYLLIKYAHWQYEHEVRCFVTLKEKDPEKDMYFADFSNNLKLVQVLVGAESMLTRDEIHSALGSLSKSVSVFKARLAFKSFKVVRQRNQKLWT
jgi:hypothetical protein